jgi:hypothetical protein
VLLRSSNKTSFELLLSPTVVFTPQFYTCSYPATAMATLSDQVVSPIDTAKPEFIVSAQSINAEPIELDGTPTSPEKVRARRASRDELLAGLDGEEKEAGLFVRSTERFLLAKPCGTLTDSLHRSAISCSEKGRATQPSLSTYRKLPAPMRSRSRGV